MPQTELEIFLMSQQKCCRLLSLTCNECRLDSHFTTIWKSNVWLGGQVAISVWAHAVFTLTFRAFSKSFCPIHLTVSTFVTNKKPHHITVDKVKKGKKKKSSPPLSIIAAIYQIYMFTCGMNLKHTFGYQLTLNINKGIGSHGVENMLCCKWAAWYSSKSGVAVSNMFFPVLGVRIVAW